MVFPNLNLKLINLLTLITFFGISHSDCFLQVGDFGTAKLIGKIAKVRQRFSRKKRNRPSEYSKLKKILQLVGSVSTSKEMYFF